MRRSFASDCIDCGECVVTCPRHSQQSWPDVKEILRQIRSGRQVVASVAPSFIADFDVGSIEDLREALFQLGFFDVQETAIGAEIVSARIRKAHAARVSGTW